MHFFIPNGYFRGICDKKICNEEYEFIENNYEACMAIIDCHEQAKNKVPTWIHKQFKNEIENAIKIVLQI
jgi:hypothetical protein